MKGEEVQALWNLVSDALLSTLFQIGGVDLDFSTVSRSTKHRNGMKVVENEAQIICGTELAKLLKIGTRVVRGLDWKLGNQGKQLEKLPSPITALFR